MDVARNAVRSAATGSYNPEGGGGAGVTAMMKLAPEVDVQAIKVLHAVSWLRVALAAALESCSNRLRQAVSRASHSHPTFRSQLLMHVPRRAWLRISRRKPRRCQPRL